MIKEKWKPIYCKKCERIVGYGNPKENLFNCMTEAYCKDYPNCLDVKANTFNLRKTKWNDGTI